LGECGPNSAVTETSGDGDSVVGVGDGVVGVGLGVGDSLVAVAVGVGDSVVGEGDGVGRASFNSTSAASSIALAREALTPPESLSLRTRRLRSATAALSWA